MFLVGVNYNKDRNTQLSTLLRGNVEKSDDEGSRMNE